MSRVVEGYTALGATIQEALERLADETDAARQVAQLRKTLSIEKTIGDDRWETINRKLDENNAKLDRLLLALGTNGTGEAMAEIVPSPRPPAPPLDEPKTDPAIRIVKKSMRKELSWQGAKLTIATTVIAIGTAFGAYRVVLSEAAAQTDAGVRVHEQRIVTLEQQQKETRSDLHELQMDIRELYRVMPRRHDSERLEKPLPAVDGGQ